MATPDLPAARRGSRLAAENVGPQAASGPIRWLQDLLGMSESAATVLGMFLYILVLASIAVVAMTGQIPWFALGPATILLGLAHIRRLEAKWAREASAQPKRAP